MQIAPNPPPKSSRAKRALFVVITDYPGGSERVSFGLASELAARPDWEVEVKIVSAQLPNSFSRASLPVNVRVSYGAAHNWFVAFPLLPFRLIFRRYDLVFTTLVYTNALFSIMRRLRLISIGRLVARESMPLFDWFGGTKERLLRWLYRAYGEEDVLIAQTHYMADHVKPWLPKNSAARLRVLANPVNMKAINAAASLPLEPELADRLRTGRNVLFCGWLNQRKRPLIALAAFDSLVRSGAEAQLCFLGSGPLEAELRKEAANRGLEERLLFLGHRTDPYPIMAACHYGLVPSAREGFPNVVLEMMACGLHKIVVTPCAGDLDQLPGVTVTRTFNGEDVAEALCEAVASGEDCSETYRTFAATRSVSAYLDAFLRIA